MSLIFPVICERSSILVNDEFHVSDQDIATSIVKVSTGSIEHIQFCKATSEKLCESYDNTYNFSGLGWQVFKSMITNLVKGSDISVVAV